MNRLSGILIVLVATFAQGAFAQGLPEAPQGLTLDQAIDKALQHNPQLKAAQDDVQRAEAEALQTRLYPLRNLSANIGFNSSVPPAGAVPAPAAGAYLTLNLGDLLSTPAALKGAHARLDAAQEGLRATTLQVVVNTTAAYAAWITQQKLLALRQEAIKSSQSDVLVIQRLFGHGGATISDVMKARLTVSQTQAELVQAEGDYNKAWATLVQQMGDTRWLDHPAKH